MKIKWLLFLAAAALLISAGNLVAAFRIREENTLQVQQTHEAAYEQYQQLRRMAEDSTLTVTEQSRPIGTYSLRELGLLEQTLAAIDGLYTAADLLPPEEFRALSYEEQIAWYDSYEPQTYEIPVVMTDFDPTAVLEDLETVARTAPADAYVYFADGAYRVMPEVPGTQLQTQPIVTALQTQAAAMTLTDQTAAAGMLEITDTDCYLLPAVTTETGDFDFSDHLAQDLQSVEITLNFHGVIETVDANALLSVDKHGRLQVDSQALDALLTGWAETYAARNTPYLFDSYVDGPTPIPFLLCDYDVDTHSLKPLLTRQLLARESGALEAPWLCFRNGDVFAIADTYIAVDIKNQHMVYYKDGELIVSTDVVTGHPDGHRTPRGFWDVRNRLPNQLLVGPDYEQFVRWWVGVHGAYGIHDASWRSEFGGELYLTDGSHGCINTPDDAMELLYETVEEGTPVLFFG